MHGLIRKCLSIVSGDRNANHIREDIRNDFQPKPTWLNLTIGPLNLLKNICCFYVDLVLPFA